MTLYNKKDKDKKIDVQTKRGKVQVNKHGFVVITKGDHKGFNTINEDALWYLYSTKQAS